MKHVKLFVALFAMLALGVTNAWGAEETITLSKLGWSAQTVQSSIPATSATISLAQNSAGTAPTYYDDGLRLYGVKSSTDGGTISFTPKKGITISKIVFTHTSSNSGVLAIKTGGGSYSSTTWSGTLTEGNTVSLVSTNSGSKNPQVRITQIVITYETSGDEETVPSLTKEQFSWSAAAASATLPDQFDEKPTLINKEDLAVTYSTSNDKVATIDTSGNVTLVGVGTADIKATAGDGVTFEETTVSYTLTVKPAPLVIEPIEGGIIDILTHQTFAATSNQYADFTSKQAANVNHSDAVYAGRSSRNGNSTQYSVQLNTIDKGRIATTKSGGIVKRVYVRWSTQAPLNTNNRELYIYGSNDAFTGSETAVTSTQIGTITFTTGTTEAYVDLTGDYKYILITGSGAIYMDEIQITWVAGETPEVPTVAAPTFSLAEGTYTEAQEVTLSAEAGTIYYTLDGTTPNAESTAYAAPIVLDECGTTTINAIAISGETTSSVASATYTIKLPLNNSQANPYTEAEAIEVYDGGCYDNQDVYVKGVVQTAQFYDKSSTYTITLEGGFQFYKFYEAVGEAAFTADYIVAGDTLVACGKLVKFNTTYELGAGCYLVERKPYSAPKVDISNTPETAYTVAQAIALIDDINSDLTKQVYVKGQISEVESFNDSYGSITYWIKDEEGNTFQCYSGLGLNSEQFASVDDLVVGSQVVVYGTLKKHNSTYELDKNNYIVSLTLPSYTVTVTAENGTVEGAGEYEHGTEVTLTATPADGYKFTCWTSGEDTVSIENPYTFPVTANVALVANFKEVVTETVYFVNYKGWENVNVYAWTTVHNAEWPGVAATKEVEQICGYDVYSYTAEAGAYATVIFNNGNNGQQTADLVWTAGKYYVQNAWYTREDAEALLAGTGIPSVITYVLRGVGGDWTVGIALSANPDDENEYVLLGQDIAEGDAVKVVTLTDGLATAYCGKVDEYSVAHSFDDNGNIVLAPGKYNFYFKVNEDLIYIAAVNPGPATALENIAVEGKAVKAIVNGQLIIIKNGVQYNAQGQVIK